MPTGKLDELRERMHHSFEDIIDLRVKGVTDTYDNSVIMTFHNGTFAFIGVAFGWEDDDMDLIVSVPRLEDYLSALERAGLITEEEMIELQGQKNKEWQEAKRRRDLETLRRLQAKYGEGK